MTNLFFGHNSVLYAAHHLQILHVDVGLNILFIPHNVTTPGIF